MVPPRLKFSFLILYNHVHMFLALLSSFLMIAEHDDDDDNDYDDDK